MNFAAILPDPLPQSCFLSYKLPTDHRPFLVLLLTLLAIGACIAYLVLRRRVTGRRIARFLAVATVLPLVILAFVDLSESSNNNCEATLKVAVDPVWYPLVPALLTLAVIGGHRLSGGRSKEETAGV